MRRGYVARGGAVILVLGTALSGCSAAKLRGLPKSDRLKCVILPLVDLTGQYAAVSPPFEYVLAQKLEDEFAHRYVSSVYSSGERIDLITNVFISTGVEVPGETDVRVGGTVQNIEYGKPEDIQDRLLMTEFFGIWGLLASEPSESARSALVEYRIKVIGGDGGVLGTFIVQGASRGPPDRERLIEKANRVAAEILAWELNERFAKELGHKPRIYRLSRSKKLPYESVLWPN